MHSERPKIPLNSARGFQKKCISIVVSMTVNTDGEQTNINRYHILVDSDKLKQQHVPRFHYLLLKTYICTRFFLICFCVQMTTWQNGFYAKCLET